MKIIDIFAGDTPVYNLSCTPVDLAGSPANFMGCVLAPKESSEAHNHFEHEIFVFTQGQGQVTQDGEIINIQAGDAVLFERFENHVITNTSATDPLFFHSIYWAAEQDESTTDGTATDKPALVFSTPPTPNGDLHLGHLSGPYMAADTLVRTLRAQGAQARHVTGRDDHQTYVLTCGMKEGRTPEETANYYDQMLQATWDQFGITRDGYINPSTTTRYAEFVQHGIALLRDKGLIVARTGQAAFDADGHYLHEAYLSGDCPHCGESSDGNACEACGRPNACVDLGNISAKLSDSPVEMKPVERLYFRMSAFEKELAQYVKTSNMPSNVASLCLDMIADGLPDICISHPGPWGLQHAEASFEDHRIYVWFEMAFGYLWGAADCPEASVQDILKAAAKVYDGQTDIVHCYGFDNAYYHTLLFPAVHMALGLTPAGTHAVNELLDLDDQKFSTSRRHLIWGRDFAKALPRDYARFALMLNRPEAIRENFTVASVASTLDDLFAQRMTRWLDRFEQRMDTRENVLPEPGAWLADHRAFYDWLMGQIDSLSKAEAIITFSPRRIAHIIRDLIVEGERFSAGQSHLLQKPHAGTDNYARTAVALEALALAVLARASRAIMPDFSAAMTAMLNQPITQKADFLKSGKKIIPATRPALPAVSPTLAQEILPGPVPVAQAAQ